MESDPMTRRHFGKAVLRLLVFGGTGYTAFEAQRGGHDPTSTFVRLGLNYSSPDKVASIFVRADSAFLMASYAVFFPEFLRRHGFDAVDAIRVAADKEKKLYPKDHHRLDALPSIAAAHLMPLARSEPTRSDLSLSVLNGLEDARREVREIVLQNLVTSVAPNFDSVRFFSVEPDVLLQIREILSEACDNEKLLTPALLCAEFLLNARSLLKARTASTDELRPYNEAIEVARQLKAPHLWYVPTLIRLHENTFRASATDVASLPPQSSEALMGWRNLGTARDYLSLLAIARARLMYTNLMTVTGKLPPDAAMSVEEAKRALPKTIAFFNAFDLRFLLKGSPILNQVPSNEPKFANFLQTEFKTILNSPDKFRVSTEDVVIDKETTQLGNLVPFAQFEDRSLLVRVLRKHDERDRKAILSGLLAATGAAISVDAMEALLAWLAGRKAVLSKSPQEKVIENPQEEEIEKARSEIEKRESEIDEGKYIGLDQQQADLGDIDLDELRDNDPVE